MGIIGERMEKARRWTERLHPRDRRGRFTDSPGLDDFGLFNPPGKGSGKREVAPPTKEVFPAPDDVPEGDDFDLFNPPQKRQGRADSYEPIPHPGAFGEPLEVIGRHMPDTEPGEFPVDRDWQPPDLGTLGPLPPREKSKLPNSSPSNLIPIPRPAPLESRETDAALRDQLSGGHISDFTSRYIQEWDEDGDVVLPTESPNLDDWSDGQVVEVSWRLQDLVREMRHQGDIADVGQVEADLKRVNAMRKIRADRRTRMPIPRPAAFASFGPGGRTLATASVQELEDAHEAAERDGDSQLANAIVRELEERGFGGEEPAQFRVSFFVGAEKNPSVAEIRKMSPKDQEQFLLSVAHRHQMAIWSDNREFKRAEAYVNRLERAGFTIPSVPNIPPPGFQD